MSRCRRRLAFDNLLRHLGHDGIGIVFDDDAFGENQIAHVQNLIHLQLADIDANRFRHAHDRAFHVQVVDLLYHDAAGRHARSGAAQLHAHIQRDALIGGDAGEIGVEDILAERVPLQLTNQRLLDFLALLEINDARPMTNRLGQFIRCQENGNRAFSVTINNGRDFAQLTQAAGFARPATLAFLSF